MAVQYIEMTEGGTTSITNTDLDVHWIFYGAVNTYTVQFAAANTFSTRRLYRISNDSDTAEITVSNSTGSITDLLLPGNLMQITLTDTSTAAGNWRMRQHITGSGGYEA